MCRPYGLNSTPSVATMPEWKAHQSRTCEGQWFDGAMRIKFSILMAILPMLILVLVGCGGLSEAEKRVNAGVELGQEGRLEEAITEFDEAIRLNPQDADAYYNRGNTYDDLGQHQRAIQEFDEALRLDPQFAEIYVNRGLAYADLSQHQRAIQEYDEAIRLNPQFVLAYYNRGLAYGNLGQHQRAIQDFDAAIRLDPQLADAYAGRAMVYTLLGKDTEAQQGVDRAVELGFDPGVLKEVIEELRTSGLLPIGQGRAGQTLVISIDEISRVQEVRYRGTDLNHYLIVPASQDNELVVLRLNVHNAKVTRFLMMVDKEAAELRGLETKESYELLDVTPTNKENVKMAEGPHPSECLSECFIWGPISLEQGHSVIGQVLFETPEGTKLKELRWVAGDIVHLGSTN